MEMPQAMPKIWIIKNQTLFEYSILKITATAHNGKNGDSLAMECPLVMPFSIFTIELAYLCVYSAIEPIVYWLKLTFVLKQHVPITPHVGLLCCCSLTNPGLN